MNCSACNTSSSAGNNPSTLGFSGVFGVLGTSDVLGTSGLLGFAGWLGFNPLSYSYDTLPLIL